MVVGSSPTGPPAIEDKQGEGQLARKEAPKPSANGSESAGRFACGECG